MCRVGRCKPACAETSYRPFEVVPSMQLPANSEAAPRLVERLNDTMTMIERTAAPKRVDDYQAPGTSLQPTGPSLS